MKPRLDQNNLFRIFDNSNKSTTHKFNLLTLEQTANVFWLVNLTLNIFEKKTKNTPN